MRTPMRLLAVAMTTLATVLFTAVAASADTPATWQATEGIGFWGYTALLVGAPVALIVVIALLTLLTSRRHFVPESIRDAA